MARFSRLLVVVSLVLSGCSSSRAPSSNAGGVSATLANTPATLERRLTAIRTRLDALARDDWNFWKTHGPDREHGGFHGTLDRSGKPVLPTDKGLIQQSRHLWTTSLWYEKRERSPEVAALSRDLYGFLTAHFYDPSTKLFHFKVGRDGAPVDTRKVLYANAFAIYALVQYERAYAVKEAGTTALACFRALDALAHDAEYGGYYLANDPPWLTPGAAKETNTHLHLMEAFSTLFTLTGDPVVKARLEELVGIFGSKIVQAEGFARKDFSREWRPVGEALVSYGHDLETSWLLVEAAESLGRAGDEVIRKAAVSVGAASADWGFDAERGGYFEEGPPRAPALRREKIWWIQAEALPGLYQLFLLTEDTKYLERLEATLEFIERFQVDREHGGWFWGIGEDGKVGPRGDGKGEEWKAAYHDLRATVFTADWIASRNAQKSHQLVGVSSPNE
ncbi:MAG TPA: AGE family epimerase/isomerase [Polyangiaceae bacterium]